MGITLEIDTTEIARATESLQGIAIRAGDIQAAAMGIRLLIQQDVDLRFQTSPSTEIGGEVFGGEYWEALSEEYLLIRSDRLGGQILRDTGELLQSMTAAGNPYEIFAVTENELVFGTALAKASKLQVKRPFLFWHPILLGRVAEYIANYIGG